MTLEEFERSDFFEQRRFSHLSLNERRVVGKEFVACTFDGCAFQEAELRSCILQSTNFANCDLSSAKLTDTRFSNVTFERSKLLAIDWTASKVSSLGLSVNFDECTLNYSSFVGLKLKNTRLRECRAHEVDFSEADLAGADFSGTDLAGSTFNHTNLVNAQLETAFNYTIDLQTNRLKGARFSLPEAVSLLEGAGLVIVDNLEG